MNRIQMLNTIRRIYRHKYTKEQIEEIIKDNGLDFFNLSIKFIGLNEENNDEMYEMN